MDVGSGWRGKERGDDRSSILVALWTLIAVTLLSALAPLGPPQSQSRGSAFNPATAEVVLKTRPMMAAKEKLSAHPHGRAMADAVLSAFVPVAMMSPALLRPVRSHVLTISPPGHDIQRTRHARAPPAFF